MCSFKASYLLLKKVCSMNSSGESALEIKFNFAINLYRLPVLSNLVHFFKKFYLKHHN